MAIAHPLAHSTVESKGLNISITGCWARSSDLLVPSNQNLDGNRVSYLLLAQDLRAGCWWTGPQAIALQRTQLSRRSRKHRFAQRFQSTHNKSSAAWSGCAQFDVFTAEQLEHEEDTESRDASSCLSQVLLKSTFMSCTVHWNFAPKWRQFVQVDVVLIMKKELIKCSSGSLFWMSLTY